MNRGVNHNNGRSNTGATNTRTGSQTPNGGGNSNLASGSGVPGTGVQGNGNGNGNSHQGIRNLGNGNRRMRNENVPLDTIGTDTQIILTGGTNQNGRVSPSQNGGRASSNAQAGAGGSVPNQMATGGVSAPGVHSNGGSQEPKPVVHNWSNQSKGRAGGTSHDAGKGIHHTSTGRAGTAAGSSQEGRQYAKSPPGSAPKKSDEFSTHPPAEGGVTPLKVMRGFSVQRGEVVALSTVKGGDKDLSILQPDHDVIFHITPNAPDAGISLVGRPGTKAPGATATATATATASATPTRRTVPMGRARQKGTPGRTRERVKIRPHTGDRSPVVRRWEHMDHEGTLSRGLVRKDGSFAFTNCRPSEVCDLTDGG